MSPGTVDIAVIDMVGQDDRSRTLQILPDQGVLISGQGKTDGTTQDGDLVLLTPNGHRDTRLNGNGGALIDLGGPPNALFGLALSLDKTEAVAGGWKGVDVAAVRPTNNDDAKTVHFSLPGHNRNALNGLPFIDTSPLSVAGVLRMCEEPPA